MFGRLSRRQRVSLVVVLVATLAAVAYIISSATAMPYRPLLSAVPPAAMSPLVEQLDAQGIPFQLTGESTISVPEDAVYSARIHLAGQGLPEMEGQGFELFDESDFGMTAFTQRVNYQRALEAELARTIRHIAGVRQARVHLVLPEEALFREEQESATASVVLTMSGSANPDNHQIQSIRYLVSSAVEGLRPELVTIVDHAGRMLARSTSDEGILASGETFEISNQIEQNFEQRIIAILEPIVGPGKVRASVRVDLNTAQVTEMVEEYDPASASVRSEERSEEGTTRGAQNAEGAPGAAANHQLRAQQPRPRDAPRRCPTRARVGRSRGRRRRLRK